MRFAIFGEDPSVDVGGACFSLLPTERLGKLRPVNTMVACRTAREASGGRGKGLDWVAVLGSFPRKSTTLFR